VSLYRSYIVIACSGFHFIAIGVNDYYSNTFTAINDVNVDKRIIELAKQSYSKEKEAQVILQVFSNSLTTFAIGICHSVFRLIKPKALKVGQ